MRAEPITARVCEKRAGSAAARAIWLTHLAAVPRDREEGKRRKSEGARAQWRGEEQGPGSGLAGCEPAANRAGAGRAHHGGETRDQVREVGPRSGAWAVAAHGE